MDFGDKLLNEALGIKPKPEPAQKPGNNRQRKEEIDPRELISVPDTEKPIKPPDWIIKGVIARGDVGCTMGGQKGGKTFFWQRRACELSTGGLFIDGLAEVDPHKVLYIMYDNVSEDLLMARIKKAEWRFNRDNLRFIYRRNLIKKGATVDLDHPDSLLEKIIVLEQPDLVIMTR